MAEECSPGKSDTQWIDAKIYGPYSSTQGLLYENAEVSATKTLLRMGNLPFHYEERPNVEFMSNNERIPILRLNNDNKIICGFNAVYNLMASRGLSLCDNIADNQMVDLEAYIAVIEETLRHVEIWMCWMDDNIYHRTTAKRYGSVYRWPLNNILPYLQRKKMKQYLSSIGWGDKTVDEIIHIAENCFHSLSSKLGNNTFFFGDSPTHLDALVFGHLFSITTTLLPNNKLACLIGKFKNLERFSTNIHDNYHKNK
ncbi:Metaxin-2 [Strongyloides ratti]|uniref:Metaxin-2 n=1 Tax=Strongyloides ratti TaxID=34506 RepID=A0A090LKH0_STRRB|nr:Metaxin-2 [Strongyloides ratti]CEF70302.1 Metaxin-2 [Strongyloides ratti]